MKYLPSETWKSIYQLTSLKKPSSLDEQVLLVHEEDWYELPGGRVNGDESNLPLALKREIKEELSAEIEVGDLYSASLYTNKAGKRVLVLVYKCRLLSPPEQIKARAGEIKDWKLFSKAELNQDFERIYKNSQPALSKFKK